LLLLLLLLSCFHDFWLFEWNSWIGVWLVLKHVWIHFINDYLYLCVDGFLIGVVVLKFVWEMRKMVFWWWFWDELMFNSMFVMVLNAFYVCNQVYNFWGRIWGQWDQKMGFWCEMGWFSREEKPKNRVVVWCNSRGKLITSWWQVAQTSTHVFVVLGYLRPIRTVPNWFFWCN